MLLLHTTHAYVLLHCCSSTTSIEQTLELHSTYIHTGAHSRALSHEWSSPIFSHAFSSKVLCIIVYTLDIWLALVHVMHCMALVHHEHGLPSTYLPIWCLVLTCLWCYLHACYFVGTTWYVVHWTIGRVCAYLLGLMIFRVWKTDQ